MNIDLETIDEHLEKAKKEVAFWELAREVLLDPRISGHGIGIAGAPRLYGELRGKVFGLLPNMDTVPGIRVKQIVDDLKASGYVFTAKIPEVAVNEALVALQRKGQAKVAGKEGIARLWTKGENQEAP